MAPKLPLPADADLPEEIRTALASLPPLNVFRTVAAVPESFSAVLAARRIAARRGARSTSANARDRDPRASPVRPGPAYEWAQHAPARPRSVGVTDAEIEALASDDAAASLDRDAGLACRAADEISRDVRLSDEGLDAADRTLGRATERPS